MPGYFSTYEIHKGDLPPYETVKCGNRTDLPKRMRRHDYTVLGIDVRNCGERGFLEGYVSACVRCGKDDFHRLKEGA